MNTRLSSGAAVLSRATGGLPRPVTDSIGALWFIAGAAMLLFAAFLAVLLLAGIGFRIGPRARRQRPTVVFTVSTAVVVIFGTALGFPHPDQGIGGEPVSRGVHAGIAGSLPATSSAASGTPVRYADGSASGSGLATATARSLVLYDTSGSDPEGAELNATMLVNLVSHFGSWTARAVGTYRAGDMTGYDAVFYLGDPSNTALPAAFLSDVAQNQHRVVWIDGDIAQLQALGRTGSKAGYGFSLQGRDVDQFVRMVYKGTTLPMDSSGGAGYTKIRVDNTRTATVLATASRADGTTAPWAVQSGNLTYISENPLLSQTHPEGRNLTFADLLFGVLDSGVRRQHRALVRLEDVNPTTDPDSLRAVIDYLAGQGVPFSVGVFPVFRDPNGVGGNGDVTIRLSERPALVAALEYATAHGGSLVLHGDTHQYGTKDNPSNGRSGDDAEFYLCHLDASQQMRLDGHVPEDSRTWALGRIDQALGELATAGLSKPSMFEFPHYMASATDYLAVGERFTYRYERSLYFPGILSAQTVDDTRPGWQMFPYVVRDVYGTTVIPENLDYVQGDGSNVSEMLDEARSNLVVRDGVASFFYHPMLGVGHLPQLVDGVRALGYTFVAGESLAGSS